jgi:hypothetical protein
MFICFMRLIMMRKFALILFTLLFCVGWAVAQVEDCPAILTNALARAQNSCAAMGGNQACYGYQSLDAQLSPGLSQFAFNGVGDITPVDTIQSLRLSALDPDTNEWGVAVMRIRADIPESQSRENVTLIAFGGVTLDPDTSGDYQPMQAFTVSTDANSSGCTNVTENGLLIQTPEGVGRVTLWVNQVKISIGSTILFQAQAGGDLAVSTFEGSAQVEVMGEMQEAVAGMTVVVPMDADLGPLAPPSAPQPFDGDATGLAALLNVSQSFTDRTVTSLLPSNAGDPNGAVDRDGDGIPDNSGSGNDCNRDNGVGEPNGNCFGHSNGNNGNGNNGNGNNGNGNGNGNGNN